MKFLLSASVEPTILYSTSSSNSISCSITVHPMLSSVSLTSSFYNYFGIFKMVSSSLSFFMCLCSSLAASYSVFFLKGRPAPLLFYFLRICFSLVNFKVKSSSSSFFKPSTVIRFFFTSFYISHRHASMCKYRIPEYIPIYLNLSWL